MRSAQLHPEEARRLETLRRYRLLDTSAEQVFDDLVQVASVVAGCPISLVSLVDVERQWFKSAVGLGATETPRDVAFCAHAILEPGQVFEIPDATQDVRFADNPLVAGSPDIRFYAGVPLVVGNGMPLGTLCVIDREPHKLTLVQREALLRLARQVVNQMEIRLQRDEALADLHAKSDFLAMVSHEIRTPMNGVVGMTGLLLQGTLDSQQREIACTIRNCADSLLVLVNDILDSAKIEAGRLELEEVPCDPIQVIEEAVSLLAEAAQAKGLGLDVVLDPGIPAVVRGDPGRIRQVLVNLLGNAVKFTSQGMVSVVARYGDGRLTIAVQDSGIGMDDAALARLFKPFVQAAASIARRYGGTGLGLTITKRLCEMMHGTIEVTSRPGAGSCFTVSLPMPAQVGKREQPDLAGRRIALPADHQAALAPWIVAWGGLPTTSGADADVILGETSRPGTPTLAIRAIAQRLPDELAQAQGFVCCLTRPIRISSLSERLQQVVRPSQGHVCAKSASPQAFYQGRILIADDYPVNVRIAVALCQHFGLTVDTASNGMEALTALARTDYDLVLMDCQMPDMDGLSATRELRRREAAEGLTRTTVVAVTANVFPEEQAECLAAGMDAHLAKPLRVQELAAVFARYLRVRPHPAAPAPTHVVAASLATSASGSDPEFDLQSLAILRADIGDTDGSILRDLLASFRLQAGEQLDIITAGTAFELIAKSAHGLKGQALTMGMQGLAQRASRCEKAAKLQDHQALNAARVGLGELFERSITAFESALSAY